MKRIRYGFLAVAVAAVAPLLAAPCTFQLNVTGTDRHSQHLSWAPVPGATQYYLESTTDDFGTTQRIPIGGPNVTSTDFLRTSSAFLTNYTFRVVAQMGNTAAADTCTGTAVGHILFDNAFRTKVIRAVVPVVAKIPGQNGSDFRTSLRLTSTSPITGTGKIIFHPAGQEGSDADPSIPYAFSKDRQVIEYADILGAFGLTGVGSIDIVPNTTFTVLSNVVPLAEAHLYNKVASGTFGSFEHHVQPGDFLTPMELRAQASSTGQYRVNIGVRTISTSTVNFDVYDANGDVRVHRTFVYPQTFTLLTSPEALLGTSLAPGESISIYAERGSVAIPFYTYTDNGTNDPSLFIPEFAVKTVIPDYEIPGIVSLE